MKCFAIEGAEIYKENNKKLPDTFDHNFQNIYNNEL